MEGSLLSNIETYWHLPWQSNSLGLVVPMLPIGQSEAVDLTINLKLQIATRISSFTIALSLLRRCHLLRWPADTAANENFGASARSSTRCVSKASTGFAVSLNWKPPSGEGGPVVCYCSCNCSCSRIPLLTVFPGHH
jgi:hypothetical protein